MTIPSYAISPLITFPIMYSDKDAGMELTDEEMDQVAGGAVSTDDAPSVA